MKKNKLFRDSFIYTISGGIQKAIAFFLLPVMTFYLSPKDMGIIAMITAIIGIVMPIMGMGIANGIMVQYFKLERETYKKFIGNSFLVLMINLIVLGLLFLLSYKFIHEFTQIPMEWIWVCIVIPFLLVPITMLSSLLRAQEKPLSFAIFNICNALLSFILTILFLAFLKWDWAGRIIAQIITASTFILFAFFYFYYNDLMRFSLTKRLIKKIYFYGIPLIPHGVGNFIIAYTDRLFITKYVGLTETGIYTVGHRVATVISLIIASFCSAFLPWQFRKLKHGNPNEAIKMMKVIYLVILLIIILTIVMNLLFPLFFKYLIGKEYTNGKVYAQWISLAAAFLGMYSVSAGFIFYYEKTKYLAYVTLIVAALNIGLNYILIKKNGAIGAAQATAIVYFLKFLSVFLLSIFLFKLPVFLRKK